MTVGIVAICVTMNSDDDFQQACAVWTLRRTGWSEQNSSKAELRIDERRQLPLHSFAEKFSSHARAIPGGAIGGKGYPLIFQRRGERSSAQRILLADISPIMPFACAASAGVHFPVATPLSWACSS